MDVNTIRILAGIGAVIVLFIIIWRRRKKASQ
jgi:LPXTG-motif cell wall-anchored protein